jgi:ubiquinol-cytochrome c reductase cytochrome c subunit
MRILLVPALAAAGVLLANALFGASAWAEPSAANGRMLFAAVGCYSCHGYEGQGGAAGPRIAPDPLPYDGLAAFVRTTSREMPPYSEKIVSDANLADIYAYLQSVPRPPDVKSVPLLNQ